MNTDRISVGTAIAMTTIAVLVDAAALLDLGLGAVASFLDIPAALLFGIWFSHSNVSMLNPKRVTKFLGTILLEIVPVVNDFPWWTFTIISTIRKEWAEPTEI